MRSDSAVMQMPRQISRFWRTRFAREKTATEVDERALNEVLPTSVNPPVDIAPNDPAVAYFQSSPGVVDIDKIVLDSPALHAMREAGVKLIVPLISQGELIGLINLGPRLSEQEYTADDRRLLENLAGQAAPALQVARMVRQQQAELQERERIEHQLRLARTIQQTLLPKKIPALRGWRLAAYYQPAWEVGGDFYDFIEFDDGRLGVIIGDVTDKGIPSALVMAATRSILRASAERLTTPGEVLRRVNDLLHDEIPPNMFVTCLYLVLDPSTGRIQYANAGHDLPYLRLGDEIVELRATGMPLGLMPGMSYEEREADLAPGACLLLYSDGLAEAHNPERDMFGFPRVQESLCNRPLHEPLIEYLLAKLWDFAGAEWTQEDDVTLVTIERDLITEEPQRDDLEPLATFEIACVQGNEREAIARVEKAVGDLDLPPEKLEKLKTAVGEATMNAMEHGNQWREDAPVQVHVSASPSVVNVKIIDQGTTPIDEPDEPDLEAKLAGDQSPRGWGLFLIRHMVDELNLTTDGKHHETELIVHREVANDVD